MCNISKWYAVFTSLFLELESSIYSLKPNLGKEEFSWRPALYSGALALFASQYSQAGGRSAIPSGPGFQGRDKQLRRPPFPTQRSRILARWCASIARWHSRVTSRTSLQFDQNSWTDYLPLPQNNVHKLYFRGIKLNMGYGHTQCGQFHNTGMWSLFILFKCTQRYWKKHFCTPECVCLSLNTKQNYIS